MAQHLRLPLTLTPSGRLAGVEQDSLEEIRQSVGVLAATRPGERLSVPAYGIPDPRFQPASALDDYAATLVETVRTWEKRTSNVRVGVEYSGVTPDSATLVIG